MEDHPLGTHAARQHPNEGITFICDESANEDESNDPTLLSSGLPFGFA